MPEPQEQTSVPVPPDNQAASTPSTWNKVKNFLAINEPDDIQQERLHKITTMPEDEFQKHQAEEKDPISHTLNIIGRTINKFVPGSAAAERFQTQVEKTKIGKQASQFVKEQTARPEAFFQPGGMAIGAIEEEGLGAATRNLASKFKEKISGHKQIVEAPKSAPEFLHEPGKDFNIISAHQGEEKVGQLNYVRIGDVASVTGVSVNPEFQNQGYGTSLYKEAIKGAKQSGAKTLTSDLQGSTSMDAARRWEHLKTEGYAVEQIPSKPGSPGYKLDLTKVDAEGRPIFEPPHPEFETSPPDSPAFKQIRSWEQRALAGDDTAFQALQNNLEGAKKVGDIQDVRETTRAIENTYQGAAKKTGVEFRGVQKGVVDHPGLAFFQDPKSGTSVAIKLDEWSPEKLDEHLTAARERMGVGKEIAEANIPGHEVISEVPAKLTSEKLVEKYGTTDEHLKAGFILKDGKMVPLGGAEHDELLFGAQPAGEKHLTPGREEFVNDEKAVRTNFRTSQRGRELVFSVPKSGVTPEQLQQMQSAVGKMGRGGNFVMEVADPAGKSHVQEFALVSDVEPALKKIGALPDIPTEWAQTAAKAAEKSGGFTINPRTGKIPETGNLVEISPEHREVLDHPATAKDIDAFYEKNKSLFDNFSGLHIGGYGNELNVSASAENVEAAKSVAKKLDQRSIYDIGAGKEIETGGEGKKTSFEKYPLEQRLAELKNEPEIDKKPIQSHPQSKQPAPKPKKIATNLGDKMREAGILGTEKLGTPA